MITKDLEIISGTNGTIYSTDAVEVFRIITNTEVLAVNWGVVYDGTPVDTEVRIVRYDAKNITLAGNTISILGATVPDEYVDKDYQAYCQYDATAGAWVVTITPDFDESNIIIADHILALAVTTAKIDNLAVTTGKIAALAVDDTKLAANSVITSKILANNVTWDKIEQSAANTVICNPTAAGADVQELAMGASTILARLAAGNIVAATVAQIRTLLACLTTTLTDGTLLIGNVANTATERTVSGDGTLSNTGVLTIADSVIEVNNLGHTTSTNRVMGPTAVKFLDGANLKALLDSGTNNLFQMTTGDYVLSVMVVTQTAHGAPATIDVGADAVLRTAGADANGFIEAANAAAGGKYSSDNATYSGALMDFGQFTVDATGYITVTSSINISAGAFVGFAMVTYIPV